MFYQEHIQNFALYKCTNDPVTRSWIMHIYRQVNQSSEFATRRKSKWQLNILHVAVLSWQFFAKWSAVIFYRGNVGARRTGDSEYFSTRGVLLFTPIRFSFSIIKVTPTKRNDFRTSRDFLEIISNKKKGKISSSLKIRYFFSIHLPKSRSENYCKKYAIYIFSISSCIKSRSHD